jgi:hypothetical protein
VRLLSFTPHGWHPLFDFRKLLSRGVTIAPQAMCLLLHGVLEFTYSSSGSKPASRISRIASSEFRRAGM